METGGQSRHQEFQQTIAAEVFVVLIFVSEVIGRARSQVINDLEKPIQYFNRSGSWNTEICFSGTCMKVHRFWDG